jgi:putative tryptophan/tyrosine transport system substrate-binding protein
MSDITRREFAALVGGVSLLLAVKVRRARGQQPVMPVVGLLSPLAPGSSEQVLHAFRRGLAESGRIEGQTVAIDYRLASGNARLAELAADLARRQVSVIAASGSVAAVASKTATQTIPIVFIAAEDPVKLGLVTSLARPGGNATGLNFFTAEVNAKRLGLLRELLPATRRVAMLMNPTNPINTSSTLAEVEQAARDLALQIQIVNASTSHEIDVAFAALARERPDALFVAPDGFFTSRRVQLAALAARYAIPTSFSVRDHVEAGGLMSYGASLTDAYRQLGVITGRILKGIKPADLPVEQSTKFELVINAYIARMLGLTVPDTLLARADEVIE